uniref:Uncharacterized protein n=1 Tax=Graphocephala atropunctata TaxID=36148 RepID=A0A1B6L833_9HEMI
MSIIIRYSVRRAIHFLGFSRCYSELPDRNKPVKFTTSEAASWRAEFSRQGNIYDDTPEAQPFIVSISTGIFLLYFLLWREESDVDEKFNIGRSIYDRVEDLEEVQLKLYRQDSLNKGKDVKDIDSRLQELERVRLEKAG